MRSENGSHPEPDGLTRRTLLRRGAVTAGALAIPAGVLQACGGGGDEAAGGAGESASGTVGYIKGPFGEDDRKWIQDTARPFLSSHPDVDLQVSFYDWASRDAQMAAAYASGSPPDVAYLGDGIWVPFGKAGALEDLTSRVRDADFQDTFGAIAPRFWDAATSEGKVYGVPLYSSSSVTFVNRDLMRQAGVKDWTSSTEAMRRAAAQVKDRTGQWGYATSVLFGESGYGTVLPAIWASGTQLYDEGMTRATVDTPAVASQLDVFRGMYVDDQSAPKPGLYDGEGLAGLFTAGKLAMYSYFTDPAEAILTDARFDWELVPMPPLESGADPATYVAVGCGYISSRGDKDASWEFLKYMSSKRGVDKYRTFVPAVYGCRDDLTPTTDTKPLAADAKYYTDYAVPYGTAVPSVPNAPSAVRALCSEFEQVCSGKKSGADAASAMNEQLQAALQF